MSEEIEELDISRRLLVIAFEQDWSLSLEENPFPPYVLSGIADWLSMYAEMEMQAEMEGAEEAEDE